MRMCQFTRSIGQLIRPMTVTSLSIRLSPSLYEWGCATTDKKTQQQPLDITNTQLN